MVSDAAGLSFESGTALGAMLAFAPEVEGAAIELVTGFTAAANIQCHVHIHSQV
jgi:hypothetical protein